MKKLLQPLRIRLALTGFGAIYTPVLVLMSVIFLTGRIDETEVNGELIVERSSTATEWPAILVTAAILAPIAAGFAWWWSGRATRPVEEAIRVQEHLIEEASHELRTPLSIMATNADVLLEHPEPTLELYRAGLERTRRAVARMTDTMEELLVDARGRSLVIDRRPTDVAALARSVVDSLQPLAKKHGVTLTGPATGSAPAAVDPSSVQRALANLVTNALQHSPVGGVVTTEVDQSNGFTRLTVSDQGPGIETEHQSKIFERYWRGNTATGSGLGLTIVQHVAAAHGGTATVTSPNGTRTGSTFSLTLKTATQSRR